MRSTWRAWMALALLAGLAPLLPVSIAVADDAVVAAPCGEAEFDAALATALTNGGGTITFACGGPTTITFTSQKTITAGNSVVVDGADLITLDGGDATRLFFVEAGAFLDLRNLTVTNGRANPGNGGAIWSSDGTLTVSNSRFTSNQAGNVGGAIYVSGAASTTIIANSTFTGNRARIGGGVSTRGMVTITGSTFTDNVTTSNGFGGAIAANGVLIVGASTFVGNESQNGGGAILMSADPGDQLDVTDSIFTENASEFGGAIYNDLADATIDNSRFTGNIATGIVTTKGGAIFMNADDAEKLDVTNSTFTENAADNGGAIYNEEGDVTIDSSQFTGNTATSDGGAIYNFAGMAAVIASQFTSNQSGSQAGAVFNTEYGAILTVERSAFVGNMSNNSGGALQSQADTTATITDSAFSGNSSLDDDGGAIRNLGTMTITRSTVSGNSADDDGGGIQASGISSTTIESSTISGNIAGDAGGGVRSESSTSAVAILDSTITENDSTADSGADGIDNGSSTIVTLQNSIVAGNDTDNAGTDCIGPITSVGYNLDSDGSCSLGAGGDIPNGTAALGSLADNGGPTMTHLPMETSDAVGNGGGCSGTDQRGRPRPVEGCEIGSVELQTAATYVLCANYYTGRVLSPYNGQCGAGTYELNVPEIYPLTFCIDPYTGIVHAGYGACNPPRQAHVMPDAGDLLTCVNLYTGVNRRVYSEGQCTAYELPNLIPATQ